MTDAGRVPRRRSPGRLRLQTLLSVAAATVIVGLAVVVPVVSPLSASPAAAASASGQQPVFVVRVMELPPQVDRAVLETLNSLLNGIMDGDGVVVARVTGASTLIGGQGESAVLDAIFDHRAKLAVQVALPERSRAGERPDLGTAGSVLLAVAGHRFADADAARAALARNSGAGGQQTPCGRQCQEQVAGTEAERASGVYATNTDPFLLDVVLRRALQVDTSAVPSGLASTAEQPPPSGQGGSGRSFWVYALIVIVLLGLGAAVLRRRGLLGRGDDGAGDDNDVDEDNGRDDNGRNDNGGRDGGGGGYGGARPVSPVAQPNIAVGPLGIIHSAFGPQGYVAVDGGLYRATWKGSGSSRPRVGDQVRLTTHEVDGLQAWPPYGRPGR